MQYSTESVEEEQEMIARCTGIACYFFPDTNEGNTCVIRLNCLKLARFCYANPANAIAQAMVTTQQQIYTHMRSTLDKTSLEKRVGVIELDIDEIRDQVREQALQRKTAIAGIDARFDNLTNAVHDFKHGVQYDIGILSSTVKVVQYDINVLSSNVVQLDSRMNHFQQAVQSEMAVLSSTVKAVQSEVGILSSTVKMVQSEMVSVVAMLNEILMQIRKQ